MTDETVVRGPRSGDRPAARWPRRRRTAGVVNLGTVGVVVTALSATLLGGGLASRRDQILDGNTWILSAPKAGVQRLLRINPDSGAVDLQMDKPKGTSALAVRQSNATTAVVDADGTVFALDARSGAWIRSTTQLNGRTRLHLTAEHTFVVDLDSGHVRQLDTARVSTPVGRPVSLGSGLDESVVDGSGVVWAVRYQPARLVAVEGGASGPSVRREFALPTAGRPLTLTTLRSGVLVGDAGQRTAYRVGPEDPAIARITGAPARSWDQTAATSDDDTGAVLDETARTLTRIAPRADARNASFTLGADVTGHRFGRPVVFNDRIYLLDRTAGRLLRTTPDGTLEDFPRDQRPGKDIELFVDDGRLWVNAPGAAKAFAIDPRHQVTRIEKFRPLTRLPVAPGNVEAPDRPRASVGPIRSPGRALGASAASAGPRPATRPPAATRTNPPPATTTPPPEPMPGAPTFTGVQAGDGQVSPAWDPPAENTDAVTGYVLTWAGPDGVETTTSFPRDARSTELTGLANGSEYVIRLHAESRAGDSPATEARATPRGAPGVTIRGVTPSWDRQIVVSFGVDQRSSGAVTCRIRINGEEKWASGDCPPDVEVPFGGLAYSTVYDVTVQATNVTGQVTTATGQARTQDPPSVTIAKDASAVGVVSGGVKCTHPSCAWIRVSIANFQPGQTFTVTADSSAGGGFPARRITADGNGAASIAGPGQTFYFGYPGQTVWANVAGTESNRLPW